ncbi:hypothetical protein [Synechococcus sp. PCC 7336]|uniref:type IV pilus modification PilV family protein n=1 Tax=Synechococcus sp. PCC 7336 TaxID=195250 RepID=UPI00034709BA|nr:hypothetical protein [Synechococcus sp. PCC 7336]
MKSINFKKVTPNGFTLAEVLAATIVVLAFAGGSFPLLALSSIGLSGSERFSTATTLVQQDLDLIRDRASRFNGGAMCTTTTIAAFDAFLSLPTSLPDPINTGNYSVGDYSVVRTTAISAGVETLQVTYQVQHDPSGEVIIDGLASEVMPSYVYLCPT